MALGEERGYSYATERDIAALFVIPAEGGDNSGSNSDNPAFTLRATPAFERNFGTTP